MYEVKRVMEDDFYTLLKLHYELQQLLPMKANRLESARHIIGELAKGKALALGLYKDTILVGFINGYQETEEVYFFANIYVKKDSRRGVKQLMTFAETIIKEHGYKQWKGTSILPEGMNILERFGGVKK